MYRLPRPAPDPVFQHFGLDEHLSETARQANYITRQEEASPSLLGAATSFARGVLGGIARHVANITSEAEAEDRADHGVPDSTHCCSQTCVLSLGAINPGLFRRATEGRDHHRWCLAAATNDAGAVPSRNPNAGKPTMFGHTGAGKGNVTR